MCSHCGKGFVEASNLTKHIRTRKSSPTKRCAFTETNGQIRASDLSHALILDVTSASLVRTS